MNIEKALVTAVLAVQVGMMSMVLSATQIDVAAGDTLNLPMNDASNKAGNDIVCAGNATIKMTNPNSAKEGRLNAILVAINGTVTVDIRSCGFTNFVFNGGVVNLPTGKLLVVADAGLESVDFGYIDSSSTIANRGVPIDIGNLEIQVAEAKMGEDYPVILRGSFTLIRPPVGYDWQIAKGSYVHIGANTTYRAAYQQGELTDDVLAKFYSADQVLDIGPDGLDVDMVFLSNERTTGLKKLHVGGNHFILFSLSYYDNWWSNNRCSNSAEWRLEHSAQFDIELDGADTAFKVYERKQCYVTGDVTGTGKLVYYWGNSSTDSIPYTYFLGRYLATGPVISEEQSSQPLQCVVFNNPEGYIGDGRAFSGEVSLKSYNYMRWEFTNGLPYSVSLDKLTTSGKCVAIYGGTNTTITLKDLEGCVRLDSGTNNVVCAGATLAWYMSDAYYLKSASGTLDFSQMAGNPDRVLLVDGAKLKDALPTTIYEVDNNAKVEINGVTNLVHIETKQDSVVTVKNDSWTNQLDDIISVWLDADAEGTYTNVYQKGTKTAATYTTTDDKGNQMTAQSLGNWVDWRMNDNSVANLNWTYGYDPKTYPYIYPHIVPNGLNGRNYMSMWAGGKNCRFDNALPADFRPKYAILVFGSQHGGGAGIFPDGFGNAANARAFGRGNTLDSPIISNNVAGLTFWVDGEKVADPTKTYFSGGWQVISVNMNGDVLNYQKVKGLGFSLSTKDAGNQNYAEVLLFSRVLSEAERQQVESYLVSKWGLQSTYKGDLVNAKVNATGSGTIVAKCDVALTGAFEGELQLGDGGSLDLTEIDPLPPGEEAVPSGRAAWFDADRAETLVETSVVENTGSTLVKQWYNSDGVTISVTGERKIESDTKMVHSYYDGRSPKLVRSARGKGAERNWIDFSEFDATEYVDADALRFGTYPAHTNEAAVYPLEGLRTVFVVQDSSRGGGTAFLDKDLVGSSIKPRLAAENLTSLTLEEQARKPIWGSTSAKLFGSGATYLNGIAVDGTKRGFNFAPEQFTAVSPEDTTFSLGVFGAYKPREEAKRLDVGEIIGEVIAYSRELSEEERKGVEGYLMWKWFGGVRDGYACLTNMTISGSGMVTAKAITDLPPLKEGFAGDVKITEQTLYNFTIAGGTAAINGFSTEGRVEMPANGRIVLTVDMLRNDGEYTLLRAAGGGLGATTWKLDSTIEGRVATRIRRAELVTSDTEVKVYLWLSRGMVITYEN